MMRERIQGSPLQPNPIGEGDLGGFEDVMQGQHAGGAARQAALVLHALPSADRDWLLQQLPTSHRERLSSLLAELAELGIPPSAAMLDDIRPRAQNTRQASAFAVRPSSAETRLVVADPKQLARLLEREPAAITARLLSLRDWPWTTAVLKRLTPARRRQIELQLQSRSDRAGSGRTLRLLDVRLLALLDERLADRSAETGSYASLADRDSPRWRLSGGRIEPLVWLRRLSKGRRAGLHTAASKVVQ